MIHSFPLRLYNEVVATHLNLESVLMPIGDGMTVSKVKAIIIILQKCNVHVMF